MASWTLSSKLVIKCTKCNVNFTPLDKISKLWFIKCSYKPCTHPHPPTASQKKVALTHTHPHQARKRSHSSTVTYTQTEIRHTRPHPPTPSQNRVTLTHTHPLPAKKTVTLTHTHPQPAKKGHTNLNLALNLWKRKFFIIHSLIKFIRNWKSISVQYQTNDKSAAVINNFRHVLIKNYIPFTCHFSRFHFTSSDNVLFFFLPRLLFCIIFAVTFTIVWTVHNMLVDLIQKKYHIMKEGKNISHTAQFYLWLFWYVLS